MICDGFLTRSGVFSYRNADGSVRREYRPPEEVFHADALASFEAAPVTDDHPSEPVTAANAKKFSVGNLQGVPRRDGELVAATLLVQDADAISKMESGKSELSCGYEVELDLTPGVSPDGERYDAVQRKIRGNHVAIVSEGRAGPIARVRMDVADVAFQIRADVADKESGQMNLEEMQKALSAALERATKAEARADKAESELAAEKDAHVATQARADSEKARADKAEKERADGVEAARNGARARAALESRAAEVLGKRADGAAPLEEMTDSEIQIEVIEKIDGQPVPEERRGDASYLAARFDSAMLRADSAEESFDRTSHVAVGGRRVDKEDQAKAEREKRNRANWAKKAGRTE